MNTMTECNAEPTTIYELADLFQLPGSDQSPLLDGGDFSRTVKTLAAGGEAVLDRFQSAAASCCFLRASGDHIGRIQFITKQNYGLKACAAGGWLLTPQDDRQPSYWIPQPPHYRALDADGHILSHQIAPIVDLGMNPAGLRATVELPSDRCLDVVIWQLGRGQDLRRELEFLHRIELQPLFLWSSHTLYERPADVYAHLVCGHVYENHAVWPRHWRVCSELDAYAIYVALSGLARSTGKKLYSLLKQQIVFSVIARQAADGGWYHGEWTDAMESHYRLHGAAMHLLAQALEENPVDVVRQSLEKAAAFISRSCGHIDSGVWFLHDSMEQNEEAMRRLPFKWIRSRALGKSPTNLLVLNTHLDTAISLQRYKETTGDARYSPQLESAAASTRRVLASQPLEWIYRLLFRAIGLTLLPTEQAKRLSLPVRAVKRVAWKYLIPLLPRLKARFPRLIMPGGFIERDLSLCGWSDQYQSVTLMDLIHYSRFFPDDLLKPVIDRALIFTQESGIRQRWMELPEKNHALGFWAEALYRLCMLDGKTEYRGWLAEAMLDCADHKTGLSPSLLGGNAEVVAPADQVPCPSATDRNFLLANLSRARRAEFMIVNSSDEPLLLEWENPPTCDLRWRDPQTGANFMAEQITVPPRRWLLAQSANPAL